MSKILNLALVGVPNVGKTQLIDKLKIHLKDSYNVLTIPNAMSYLDEIGLIKTCGLSNMNFQHEYLTLYSSFYSNIMKYAKLYNSRSNYIDHSKPTIILHENTPLIGKIFISEENIKLQNLWESRYKQFFNSYYKKLGINKIYVVEMGKGEYKTLPNIDTDKALSLESKIIDICMNNYLNTEILFNSNSIEDKISCILDYIDSYFHTIPQFNVRINQRCPSCDWSDYNPPSNLYKFCPMCGFVLGPYFKKRDDKNSPSSPLQADKMFYVDHSKLPIYTSTDIL